jgi:hypothetical protein
MIMRIILIFQLIMIIIIISKFTNLGEWLVDPRPRFRARGGGWSIRSEERGGDLHSRLWLFSAFGQIYYSNPVIYFIFYA